MMLSVDPRSATPPYEQVRVQIIELVRAGELAPGTRLPTVRRLAGDLGIAPNTVARAYRELESAAVLETRGRQGTFVAVDAEVATSEAATEAARFAERVRQLGVAPDEGLRLAARALGLPG
jgi:DNA-binding transcriptional regulator YhcF (GntR family)